MITSFNQKSFNQAYIHASLAKEIHELVLDKKNYSGYIHTVEEKVEKRHNNLEGTTETEIIKRECLKNTKEAMYSYGTKMTTWYRYYFDKKEIDIYKKITHIMNELHQKFYEHFKKGTSVTSAWRNSEPYNLYNEYILIKHEYKCLSNYNLKGNVIDRYGIINIFFTDEIHAAANENDTIFYPAFTGYQNLVFVFERAFKKNTMDILLHEIGHVLGLKHTFKDSYTNINVGNNLRSNAKSNIMDYVSTVNEFKAEIKNNVNKEIKNQPTKTSIYAALEDKKQDIPKKITESDDPEKVKASLPDSINKFESSFLGNVFLAMEIEKEAENNPPKKIKNNPKTNIPNVNNTIDKSKTLENYMDYKLGTSSFKHKLFYKWQWDAMREFGDKEFFILKDID